MLVLVASVLAFTLPRDKLQWDVIQWNPQLRDEFLLHSFLYPALLGGLVGSGIGAALWATVTRRAVPAVALALSWWLLGGVAGFLAGVGVFFALLAGSGRAVGRAGVSPLILLPPPALAILASAAGAAIGVMKARARNRQRGAAATEPGAAPGPAE